MTDIAGITRGGTPYTPQFILSLDRSRCIGCGRCYKVCARDVFALVEREDGGADVDDDDDESADATSLVMSLADPLDCIGCEACAKVCSKACMTHGPSAVVLAD